jgi:hypothetical protein
MTFLAVMDGAGVYGSIFHYASVIAFVGSAFLVFLYLWKTNRLDMDEGPKYQMMNDDEKLRTVNSDDNLKDKENPNEPSK